MDEGIEVISPWAREPITDDCVFFRHIPIVQTSKNEMKRRFPNESHFSLHPESDGLSFNWSGYADENRSLTVLGLTKGRKGDFIDIKNYLEFKFPVKILKETTDHAKILHDPLYHGNPSNIGLPNNKSHALFSFDPDDVEVRVLLSSYCYGDDQSLCKIDNLELNNEINKLHDRANNTPYHRLWDFGNDD